jgi:serine/threonine-protein kinase
MQPPPWEGHIIAGRYRLGRLLGRGNMGTVWRAEHLLLHSPVAIKIIDPGVAMHEDGIARFVREARAAAALRSPHVVQILDFGVDGLTPFIAMELLEGETLGQRLERRGVLSPVEVVRILSQVARAMGRAHDAGIVHRDLKPENVFLVHNDDEEVVKVLDFGIAKIQAGPGLPASNTATRAGSLMGSPCYMSPEQAWGSKSVDWRTDLWSLAVIAYECLCGQRPFDSQAFGELIVKICTAPVPVPSRVASVPPGFDVWFARAAHRDPAQRFQSARDLSRALRTAILPGSFDDSAPTLDIPAPRPLGSALRFGAMGAGVSASSISVRQTPLRNRPPIAALLAGAAVFLAVAFTGAWWWLRAGRASTAAFATDGAVASSSPSPSDAASSSNAAAPNPSGEPPAPVSSAPAEVGSAAAGAPEPAETSSAAPPGGPPPVRRPNSSPGSGRRHSKVLGL